MMTERGCTLATLKEPRRACNVEQRMEEQGKPILSATEARQATRGQGVRYVLAASVALALVAMLVAYLVA
jgi:hypothetical protein